jgi:hypothetical protein
MDENEIKVLYRHLNGSDKYDFWYENYILCKCSQVAIKILPFIHRGIKDFTSHGIDHSKSVIVNINNIIDILNSNKQNPTQTEIKLLYMAAWLHDIGNLKENCRGKHSLVSCDLIDKLNKEIGLKNYLEPLKIIVKFHSSGYKKNGKKCDLNLSKVPNESFKISGDIIRLPMICAIFRLADACDIGEKRAYDVVYSLIKDELDPTSKKHWESNNAIVDISFEPKNRCIKISVKKPQKRKALFIINQLKTELESVLNYLGDTFPCREIKIDFVPISDYK